MPARRAAFLCVGSSRNRQQVSKHTVVLTTLRGFGQTGVCRTWEGLAALPTRFYHLNSCIMNDVFDITTGSTISPKSGKGEPTGSTSPQLPSKTRRQRVFRATRIRKDVYLTSSENAILEGFAKRMGAKYAPAFIKAMALAKAAESPVMPKAQAEELRQLVVILRKCGYLVNDIARVVHTYGATSFREAELYEVISQMEQHVADFVRAAHAPPPNADICNAVFSIRDDVAQCL